MRHKRASKNEANDECSKEFHKSTFPGKPSAFLVRWQCCSGYNSPNVSKLRPPVLRGQFSFFSHQIAAVITNYCQNQRLTTRGNWWARNILCLSGFSRHSSCALGMCGFELGSAGFF